MPEATTSVIIIGYGNPGRGDDGLGPAVAEAVSAWSLEGVRVESGYQLQVEDAMTLAEHPVVIFVDAAVSGPEPFRFEPLEANGDAGFTTHAMSPEAVMAIARDLLDATTTAYVLGIRGYHFEMFEERLSGRASENLAAALRFLEPLLAHPVPEAFAEAARARASASYH